MSLSNDSFICAFLPAARWCLHFAFMFVCIMVFHRLGSSAWSHGKRCLMWTVQKKMNKVSECRAQLYIYMYLQRMPWIIVWSNRVWKEEGVQFSSAFWSVVNREFMRLIANFDGQFDRLSAVRKRSWIPPVIQIYFPSAAPEAESPNQQPILEKSISDSHIWNLFSNFDTWIFVCWQGFCVFFSIK